MKSTHSTGRAASFVAFLLLAVSAVPADKVDSATDLQHWRRGPVTVELRNVANLQIPEGYLFLDENRSKALLGHLGNKTSGKEIGFIAPESQAWFVVVEFLDVGYVPDKGWRELDASAMLQAIRRIDERANIEREANAWPLVTVEDWEIPPTYEPAAKRMEWAVKATSRGATIINHTVSALGRSGVVQFSLVDQHRLASTTAAFKQLINGLSFKAGERYEDRQPGDKIASGDLAVLVSGNDATASTSPADKPAALKPPSVERYWWIVIGVACMVGFVSGKRFGKRHRSHHYIRSREPKPKQSDAVAASNLATATSVGWTVPSSANALASAIADGASVSAVEPGTNRTRRRRYSAYHFYRALTRDLHRTINH